ncbi:hypothetical protein GQ43DRAFT_468111 [Delitschia confertaspora ATCC 74209]|uniref:Uncharacterized protein n=1 Tax=Delitschia confertaspora ATCC 74209 TaxID=1513339 RepID=A0A9P4JUG2_9PLEO|nr:hypothetical protein GQ43DRAFT_468111 [Delitschia confertaspora ATCC 74209]
MADNLRAQQQLHASEACGDSLDLSFLGDENDDQFEYDDIAADDAQYGAMLFKLVTSEEIMCKTNPPQDKARGVAASSKDAGAASPLIWLRYEVNRTTGKIIENIDHQARKTNTQYAGLYLLRSRCCPENANRIIMQHSRKSLIASSSAATVDLDDHVHDYLYAP